MIHERIASLPRTWFQIQSFFVATEKVFDLFSVVENKNGWKSQKEKKSIVFLY